MKVREIINIAMRLIGASIVGVVDNGNDQFSNNLRQLQLVVDGLRNRYPYKVTETFSGSSIGGNITGAIIEDKGVYPGRPFGTPPVLGVIGEGSGAELTPFFEIESARPTQSGVVSGYLVDDTITVTGNAVFKVTATGLWTLGLCTSVGSGYEVDEILTLLNDDGTMLSAPTLRVLQVNGSGGITSWTITPPSGSFTVNSTGFSQSSSTGSGTGATFSGASYGVSTFSVLNKGSYDRLIGSLYQLSTSGSGVNVAYLNTIFGMSGATVISRGFGYDDTTSIEASFGGAKLTPIVSPLEGIGTAKFVSIDSMVSFPSGSSNQNPRIPMRAITLDEYNILNINPAIRGWPQCYYLQYPYTIKIWPYDPAYNLIITGKINNALGLTADTELDPSPLFFQDYLTLALARRLAPFYKKDWTEEHKNAFLEAETNLNQNTDNDFSFASKELSGINGMFRVRYLTNG